MRKLFLTQILISLVWVGFSQTNWTKKDLGTNENFNKIYFATQQLGFIVGDNGTLLKTEDGGLSWQIQSTAVTHNLHTIAYANSNVYINGLKSTDDGATWSAQNSSKNHTVIGAFIADNLFAGTSPDFSGMVYKSVDGGATWVNNTDPIPTGLYTDAWVVNEIAYMTSWYGGHLIKSSDAGATWTNISQIDALIDDAYAVAFNTNDINVGLVAGNQGKMIKTSDAAQTWISVYPAGASTTFTGYGIEVLNNNTYIMVGADAANPSNHKKIYETSDGGANWQLLDAPQNLKDVACTDAKCFAIGENGCLMVKDNPWDAVQENRVISRGVTIYPNPASDYVHLQSERLSKRLEVYNVMGVKVADLHVQDGKCFVGNLPKGVYLLKVDNNWLKNKLIIK